MTENFKRAVPLDIRRDPGVKRILAEMPESVQESFTDEQLLYMRNAVGERNWGQHSLDCRGVLKIPFCGWCFYYVLLFGRNRRQLTRYERRLSMLLGSVVTAVILLSCILIVLIGLYLIKSALGINIFEGFSFGLWHWFKTNLF